MRRTNAPRRAVLSYVLSVGVVSVLVAAWALHTSGLPNVRELGFFWILLAIGDRLEVDAKVRGIPQAGIRSRAPSLSAGFLVVLAAAFATDPATTAFLGFGVALVPSGWRGVLRAVFNGAQWAIYGAIASAIFAIVRSGIGHELVWTLGGATIACVTAEYVNTAVVAGVLGIERQRSFRVTFGEMAWAAPHSLAFAPLALLVGVLYQESGLGAVAFILAPLFVLRQARQGKLEVEEARAATLRAFVGTVDLKSPWTSRHSANVATIAVALHRVLGVSEEQIERRYYGALLHDIGKVGVSAQVLSKNGPLDVEEWEHMRRHPGAGAFVVNDVDFLRDLVPEVLYHHERMDGSGYPSGLRGDEIPFAARVLAVADTFEALTSDRPYRRALSPREALAEIRRCSGVELDSRAVDALDRLLREGFDVPSWSVRPLAERESPSGSASDAPRVAEGA